MRPLVMTLNAWGNLSCHPAHGRMVHFQAADVRFVTGLDCVRVGEWVLCLLPDGWYASRPQPCPGRFFRVMSLRDIPAASLTPDQFPMASSIQFPRAAHRGAPNL